MKLLLLFAFLPFFGCWSQLTVKRQFQLDSIVSTIPLSIKRNAEKVHDHLDSLGKTDEEKVWMFYGFIGTYLHYDDVRSERLKAPVYSPFTTVNKSSGVCRDFAQLFDFFCEKSNIPCFLVIGKAHTPFLTRLRLFFHGHFRNKINHEWNVVNLNGSWQLMDPTWTYVDRKTKIPIYDKKGKLKQTLIVKSVNRIYYNPDPLFMAQTHVSANPVFFLLAKVPVYKRALRKRNKKFYSEEFNFQRYLDAQINNRFAEFNRTFDTLSLQYSGESFAIGFYRQRLNEPLLKRTPHNTFSLDGYQKDSTYCADLQHYMITKFHHYDKIGYNEFLKNHELLKQKYLKSQPKKK